MEKRLIFPENFLASVCFLSRLSLSIWKTHSMSSIIFCVVSSIQFIPPSKTNPIKYAKSQGKKKVLRNKQRLNRTNPPRDPTSHNHFSNNLSKKLTSLRR